MDKNTQWLISDPRNIPRVTKNTTKYLVVIDEPRINKQ